MDTESESLRVALVEEVAHIKDEHAYPDLGRAFQHWSAVNVLGIGDEDVAVALDGAMGTDGGIDYFHVNNKTKTIEILQTKFSEVERIQTDKNPILELYTIPTNLMHASNNHSSHFKKLQKRYTNLKKKKYTTRLQFITTSTLPESMKINTQPENFNMPSDTKFKCLELKDLIAYVGNPRTPTCYLHLIKDECFIGAPNSLQTKRLVSTVPASELKKACDFAGIPTLFSLNPRSSLENNPISDEIKDTIEKQPERLWHYNNGISATCERFTYDKKTGIVEIENLKVVNGCQTVTTIADMNDVNRNAALVLRLSETADTAFSEKISEYTNRQASIKSADLLSNHAYLINLEKRFKKYGKFFFERKKGQRSGVHSKKDLYVIKSVDAARMKMAYDLGLPHLSMQMPESNIFRFDSDDPDESDMFSKIYKNGDPRDFIISNVFYHLFGVVKKNVGKYNPDLNENDKNDIKYMLKYKIGKYYVLGMIGKIFASLNTATKDTIVDGIICNAIAYDSAVINRLSGELTTLVDSIVHDLKELVDDGDDKPFHEHDVYYLRAPLCKDNLLPTLYKKREGHRKYLGEPDKFGVGVLKALDASDARAR